MQISIIGCGWLGLPLGKRLVEEGHQVLGSTTSPEKFKEIENAGIAPTLFKLEPMPSGKGFNQLFETDILIVNIPPSRKKNPPSFYEEQIKYLKYLIEEHKVPKVVFVSSTAYYPNTGGEVNENTEADLQNGSKEAVVQAEKQIRQINSELIVLRCGGLMGGSRIPGKWFSSKETPGANTPVNYIHREDVIGIIHKLIQTQNSKLGTLNLVAPSHPTRKQVHEAMAQKHGFEKPVWVEPEVIPHKVVNSNIQEALDYQFRFADPISF